MSGANTYTGATAINGGVLSISSLAIGGMASGIGASSSAAANLVLGGTLLYTGPTALTDRLFTLTANSTIERFGHRQPGLQQHRRHRVLGLEHGGTLAGTDPATLDPIIGNAAGSATSVNKTGSGTWQLNATNTYTGPTNITGGTLVGYGALTTATGSSFGLNSAITLNGGTLYFTGSASAPTSYATYSALTVGPAGATVVVDSTSGNQLTTVSAGSVARSGAGTLVITPQQGSLTVNEIFQLTLTPPTVTNGIVPPWVVVQNSGTDSTGNFATVSAGFPYTISDFTAYISGNINGQSNAVVFEAASGGANTLTGAAAVFALKVDNGINVSGNATLTVGNGAGQAGVILNGGTISATTLAFGAAEGVVYTSSAGGQISSQITGTSAQGLTVFGPGTLVLSTSAGNTYTGTTTINGGILAVNNTSGSGTGSGNVVVNSTGTLAGNGTLTLTSGNTVTVNAGGAIRGGLNDGTNNLKALTIGNSVILNSTATLLTEVSGNGTSTPNSSLINLTGSTTFNLSPGSGTFNISLLNNGTGDVGLSTNQMYTITLATVANAGNIQLNAVSQAANAVIPTSDYTLSTTGLPATILSYTLSIDGTGHDLILSLTTGGAPVPEPHQILLIGATTLLLGRAIRRRWFGVAVAT